ncbi:recombination regulator RecX [Mesorhizobium sp. RP14(2022)]|uniref:Regulatory protein RecX n=1 Tax=Mesorhizobium liriopis TaxID=2953882 RepID=A0ABT1C820_9HYPH|nr:regulatory protein RecX [Mesorhizobium liriopis]MCO6050965.1 recombination regulator RecX [Mesorhizobium liriopis]
MGEADDEEKGAAAITARMRQWARRSAMDYLSKHASSSENLRKVMQRRALRRFPEAGPEGAALLAQEALDFCREHAFVDDQAYAEMKVRSGVRKGHSQRRIALTLATKGVEREVSHEALKASDDLAAAAALARRRRMGPWRRNELDPESRRKEMAAFARNGFSGDVAFRVMDMSIEEAEDAIDEAERSA